jgi:hypothetical protein
MGRLLYQDSCGMEVVLEDRERLRLVMPLAEQTFNAAHLASLMSALALAHQFMTAPVEAPRSETP